MAEKKKRRKFAVNLELICKYCDRVWGVRKVTNIYNRYMEYLDTIKNRTIEFIKFKGIA